VRAPDDFHTCIPRCEPLTTLMLFVVSEKALVLTAGRSSIALMNSLFPVPARQDRTGQAGG